jgi:hypothetical protein
LLSEVNRREEKSKNWHEEEEATNLANQVTALISQRRRQVLSQATFEKNQEELELGRKIGKAVFGSSK